jgi:phage host-nuclease inhibitor protein Gam
MKSEKEIQDLLEQVYGVDVEVAKIATDKQAKIDSILTPELRQQIKDIEEEYAPYTNTAQNNRAKYVEDAKDGCLELGKTVNAIHFQVVWNKGKSGIDPEAVAAYFETHKDDAEVKALFKTGKPYASLKALKPKETPA